LNPPETLLLIAGSGDYPALVAREARRAGVRRIALAAFENETSPGVEPLCDEVHRMRVGQLGRMIEAARSSRATHAIMAGQLAPKNLFDLRPDFRALFVLAKLKRRNAETLFGAVADELAGAGVELLPATTFLEDHLAPAGLFGGPRLKARELADIQFGHTIAKEVSRLDIGQTVVVKNGTVLAVEAFEGTDEAIRRGGQLGRGGGFVVKVSKPDQDMRFDVPVIGPRTLESAAGAGLRGIAVEAGRTLLIDRGELLALALDRGIALYGIET